MSPALTEYLDAERAAVLQAVADHGLDHLLEIRCGQRRLLTWAGDEGLGYNGLDLAPDLIHRGWAHLASIAREPLRATLDADACEHVQSLFERGIFKDGGARSLVFFPFNYFGSLASPARTLASLARTSSTLLLSVYDPSPYATGERIAYYVRAGYSGLDCMEDERGVLVTSADGLHSYAYDDKHIRGLADESGYDVALRTRIGSIGLGYVLRRSAGTAPSRAIGGAATRAATRSLEVRHPCPAPRPNAPRGPSGR